MLAHAPDAVDPVLLALCDDVVASGVDLAVLGEDEMYKLFLYRLGHPGPALASYFRSRAAIWETLRRLLEWRFGAAGATGAVLDFASGYGRVSRFLAHALPPGRVWVADVYAGGVRFQEERFGVHGIVSTAEPEAFAAPRRFDCVFVSSLFTHLPERTFARWLGRLWSLVAPGGLLAFSVHDPSLLGEPAADGGFRFEPVSESGSLAAEEYGTAWASEAYVRRALASAAPGAAAPLRFPRALCNYQDLYVVTAEGPAALPEPPDLAGRPEGFVEACRQLGARRLGLRGWAVDRVHGAPVAEVRAVVDGEVRARCRDLPPRDEVAALFPGERVRPAGWALEVDLPAAAPPGATRLAVEAVDAVGRPRALWDGTVEAALLRAARLDLLFTVAARDEERREHAARLAAAREAAGREAAALEARIAAMEASRFWKLRNRWFAAKRALGLTGER